MKSGKPGYYFLFLLLLIVPLWPAIYNGFPIFHIGDSIFLFWQANGSYKTIIENRYTYQTSLYPLMLKLLGGNSSAWQMIALQSVVCLSLMLRCLQLLIPRSGWPSILGIAMIIACMTTMAFFTSGIKQDAFTALLPLSLFLVLREKRFLLRLPALFVFLVAWTIHLSHVPLAAGLLVVATIIAIYYRKNIPSGLAAFVGSGTVLGLIVAGILFVSPTFLYPQYSVYNVLGKLTERNLLYLAASDICANENHAICEQLPRLNNIPRIDLLWGPAFSDIRKSFYNEPDLSSRLLIHTLKARPLEYCGVVIDTLYGLVTNRFDFALYDSPGVHSQMTLDFFATQNINPDRVLNFSKPGIFVPVMKVLFAIHSVLVVFSLLVVPLTFRHWKKDVAIKIFGLLIFSSIIGNLLLTAATAPHQSRMILRLEWLIVLFGLIVLWNYFDMRPATRPRRVRWRYRHRDTLNRSES